MAIFPFSKKKKSGTVSNIAELRSPYMKKPTLPQKFFKRGKRKKSLVMPVTIRPKSSSSNGKRTLWIMGGLALTVGIIYLVGFSHFFDVKNWEIDIDNVQVTDDVQLNNLLKDQLHKNLFFIDESLIANDIKNLHPEAQKIVIEKVFPQEIKVEIQKYPIVANIINIVNGIQIPFTVDAQGFLADQNNQIPGLPYIKVFTDSAFSVHTSAIDPDKLQYILTAISLFQQEFSMKIINAEYHVRERQLNLQTEKNFFVWIDMQKDLNRQLEKLKLALPKLDIYNLNLDYIDLRISGVDNDEKVIYKLKS